MYSAKSDDLQARVCASRRRTAQRAPSDCRNSQSCSVPSNQPSWVFWRGRTNHTVPFGAEVRGCYVLRPSRRWMMRIRIIHPFALTRQLCMPCSTRWPGRFRMFCIDPRVPFGTAAVEMCRFGDFSRWLSKRHRRFRGGAAVMAVRLVHNQPKFPNMASNLLAKATESPFRGDSRMLTGYTRGRLVQYASYLPPTKRDNRGYADPWSCQRGCLRISSKDIASTSRPRHVTRSNTFPSLRGIPRLH